MNESAISAEAESQKMTIDSAPNIDSHKKSTDAPPLLFILFFVVFGFWFKSLRCENREILKKRVVCLNSEGSQNRWHLTLPPKKNQNKSRAANLRILKMCDESIENVEHQGKN